MSEKFEGGINDMLQRIYGSIDDLNNELSDEIVELRNLIRHNNQ